MNLIFFTESNAIVFEDVQVTSETSDFITFLHNEGGDAAETTINLRTNKILGYSKVEKATRTNKTIN